MLVRGFAHFELACIYVGVDLHKRPFLVSVLCGLKTTNAACMHDFLERVLLRQKSPSKKEQKCSGKNCVILPFLIREGMLF